MVFVMDTSGSMHGAKMEQARKALKFCLSNLSPSDRFGLLNFATTVNKFADELKPASTRSSTRPRWVDQLTAPAAPTSTTPWSPPWRLRSAD